MTAMPSPTPARRRARAASALLVCACALACHACHADDARSVEPEPSASPLPIVDHDAPPPYVGTWVGPALSLTFVGPWVFVRPSDDPSQPPIELRATVERREGDAFALRTSVAGLLPADFLRPTDWTMLVEDGQLAIAMGDEPLESYVRADAPLAPLLGPAMLDELELPAEVVMAEAVACLELANDRCVALEADGPLAAGCRELQWSACIAQLEPPAADPTIRAARAAARRIHRHTLTLRFTAAVLAGAPDERHADALTLDASARALAEDMLDELRAAGPLPRDDRHLPELLARLGQ